MDLPEDITNEPVLSDKRDGLLSSLTGEEIVISGMSGIFPSSNNVYKFMENLYNKIDMVIEVNPASELAEMPRHQGVIEGLEKFDAQFFKVTFNQAQSLNPMVRKLMEQAYSAIYDAGYNPSEYDGEKLGVFVGAQYLDNINFSIYENKNTDGFSVSGYSKTMMPNRISYWINGKAPSYSADFSCAGSLACLEHAYQSIKSGQSDAALVGCCNVCLLPGLFVNLTRAGMLCLDGKTKCFDKHGDGCVRSDAINMIFLQKAKDARRIYSEVYHVESKYGLKHDDNFLPYRRISDMTQFFEDFYSKIDVPPEEVKYVEAHGSAIANADANEMEAIGNFFGRKSAVQIGSVKSNMGNSEAAAGLCAIIKACLAYQTGELAGNLHYTEPQDISSVREGRVKIVQDNVPFQRGFIALNTFSYTGIDVHVLLKGHFKSKDKKRYISNIPYIVTVSARQEDCVEKVLKNLESQPVDPELIALLHKIHEKSTLNHMGRGYVLLGSNEKHETISLARSVSYYSGESRPICFLFSGMGSQWPGMGAELMRIPIFSDAIRKCDKVLRPRGIDVVKIISDTDKTMFDNIQNSFIGITAVQIGLTDILKELGIVPDLMIGHSLGEMGCAYADGCFTVEETILTSYSRGRASVETNFIPGAMAAVGLGFKDISNIIPPDIDIACHNSSESSTISGPAESVARFVELLKSNGVFAKEVQSSGISYHSRYTAVAAPKLYEGLRSVITNPKPRSEKWLSTSVPRDKWNDPIAKFSSVEYHVNNLLSPVYFEETCTLIPSNAIIIEIAPHGLLQAILKRSHAECANIPLTKRGSNDPVNFLLQAIGKIYENGLDPKVARLYPEVEFPVSTETPLLSHFVEWDHSENWPVVRNARKSLVTTGSRELIMSIYDDDYNYMKDYVRNGVNILPESFFLVLTWETLAMSVGLNYRHMPVKFYNIKFHCEITIDPESILKLSININKIENRFEIVYEDKPVVTGFVLYYKDMGKATKSDIILKSDLKMSSQDIYKILHYRGYSYGNEFRSVLSTSLDYAQGAVKWTDEWVTFLDALIQLNILANGTKKMSKPKLIQELIIDVDEHEICKRNTCGQNVYLNAELKNLYGATMCGGAELKNVAFEHTSSPRQDPDVLNNKEFCSHFPTDNYDLNTALHIYLQTIKENVPKETFKIFEMDTTVENSIMHDIQDVANRIGIRIDLDGQNMLSKHDKSKVDNSGKMLDFIVVYDLLLNKENMIEIQNSLYNNTFVLALEKVTDIKSMLENKYFTTISAIRLNKTKILFLLKKRYDFEMYEKVSYIKVDNYYKFSWLKQANSDLSSKKKVILLSVNQRYNGVVGIVKSLCKRYGNRLSLIKINDVNAPIFDPENVFYKEQLQKQLIVNTLQEGQWGGMYSLPIKHFADIENYTLNIDHPGDFNTFAWYQIPMPSHSPLRVQVHYAGISLKDVNNAMGKDTTNDQKFGFDFSGIDMNGNRVMGLVPGGSMSNTIDADPYLLWPVPEHWTLKEAATVPLAFVHAYYCLTMRTVLYKGAPVIVTGGAGALGQAIISICLAYGHNVYTLVSNNEKKKLLLKLFPKLKENQIYNSRDAYSVVRILNDATNKRLGLVINCDSGNLREEFMACVSTMGYFLDLSKTDMKENKIIGMGFLKGAKNYAAIDLSNIFKPENVLQRKELQLIITEGISTGIVKPLTSIEYSPKAVYRAFNLLSSRKHTGKILINLKQFVRSDLKFAPRIQCSSENSFVVVCDDNELGFEIIDLLVRRGANKVTLHIKNERLSGYGESKLELWRNQGVRIKLAFDDLKTEEGCSNTLNETVKMGPIEGIFIILDQAEENISEHFKMDSDYNDFNRLTSSIINLEAISRDSMSKHLRYFTIITQSPQNIFQDYVISVSEEICRARNAVGLPGMVFQVKCLNQFVSALDTSNSLIRPLDVPTLCNGLEASLHCKLNSVEAFNYKQEFKEIDCMESNLSVKFNGITDDFTEQNDVMYNMNKTEKLKNARRSKDTVKSKENFCGGLGAFYTFIDDNLYRATEPIIPMETKVVNTFTEKYELDPNATYLMLIPGFEGHSRIFEKLSLRLKIKAFTIQLTPDMKNNSIQEMATDILKLMKKRLTLKHKFYLLGYSFGVNIALELASMLEVEGHIGVIYCLDSSPDVLRSQIQSYIGQQSDTELQNSLIEHMFKLIVGDNVSSNISEDTKDINTWEEKIEYFVKQLKRFNNYSHEYIKMLLDTAYKRIGLALNYNPTFDLNSQLILVRGILHPDSKSLPRDYNLSNYSKKPVIIFDIESDTALAPYDSQVSNIINKMLDPELLENFKKSSSCEVYFYDNNSINY